MNFEILTDDINAEVIVKSIDPNATESIEGSITVFTSQLGGKCTIGVFELPSDEMLWKGKKGKTKLKMSIYNPKTNLENVEAWEGIGRSSMNKIIRAKMQPKKLESCDYILVINSSATFSSDDFINIRNSLIGLSQVKLDDRLQGRGSWVALTQLPQGRVLLERPTMLTDNGVHVLYGTSDLANVFEFIQTLKLASTLGLPALFDTYTSAHNWEWWSSGFLEPSLQGLLGVSNVNANIEAKSKYTTQVQPNEFLTTLGLTHIAYMFDNKPLPLWELYHKALSLIGVKLLKSAGAPCKFKITQTEETLKKTGAWEQNIRELALEVEQALGHPVVVINYPGGQFKSNDELANITVAELHEKGGWLGGAAIYYLTYSQAKFESQVVLMKDSRHGLVHMMLKKLMQQYEHLYVSPVNLFRLPAIGQNESWSVDPLVLLELFELWGPNKTKTELQRLWHAIPAPINERLLGKTLIATVTKGGIEVKTK